MWAYCRNFCKRKFPIAHGDDRCHSSSVIRTKLYERDDAPQLGGSVLDGSRAAQSRRVQDAARALRMDALTFVAWMVERSRRAGDPVDRWPTPWLVEAMTATRLRRDPHVVRRLRDGWRLILTFHGQPFAMVVPVSGPRDETAHDPTARVGSSDAPAASSMTGSTDRTR